MRKLALTAALIASLPTAALAEDWVFVAEALNGHKWYVDRDSIRTMPNGNKRAWERQVYAKPLESRFTSSKILREYDCREGRFRLLQATVYKGEGVTRWITDTMEWIYVPPGSPAEARHNYVCFGR